MRFVILNVLFLLLVVFPAVAQDRDGNDRPSDWVVKHFFKSGIWESICDERTEDDHLRQRCYIRLVDVFSPRPKFAAQFLFITPEPPGMRIEFGMEPGTLFAPDGFRMTDGAEVSWQTQRPGCLTGLTCIFTGPEADILLQAMQRSERFLFTFVDRHGRKTELDWPLIGFNEAFQDFALAASARGLF